MENVQHIFKEFDIYLKIKNLVKNKTKKQKKTGEEKKDDRNLSKTEQKVPVSCGSNGVFVYRDLLV